MSSMAEGRLPTVSQLDDKIAVVTGGGTGIGKGIARAFAAEGADLAIASRNRDRLEETAGELRALGVDVLVVTADVGDERQVAALFEEVMDRFGKLDILVNNSGIFERGPIDELTVEAWRRVVDVNLTGPFLCTREAMRIMKPQGGGRIINIGSISAQTPALQLRSVHGHETRPGRPHEVDRAGGQGVRHIRLLPASGQRGDRHDQLGGRVKSR